jgi:hypothetical protein
MNTHHGGTETRSSLGLLSESLLQAIIASAIEASTIKVAGYVCIPMGQK